jgi:aspartate beta-hydroxylase
MLRDSGRLALESASDRRPSKSAPRQRHAELLLQLGARTLHHGHGATLYDHLLATGQILFRWSQPDHVCTAGALHSIYGTDIYRVQLVSLERRREIQGLVGLRVERLVYLFGATRRAEFFAALDTHGRIPDAAIPLGDERVEPDEAADLLILHMANLVEQAQAKNGEPAHWVSRVLRWGSLLRPCRDLVPEIFGEDPLPGDEDERRARRLYADGFRLLHDSLDGAASALDRANERCPVLGEPAIWRAYVALRAGDRPLARDRAARGRFLLERWAAPWDKRLPLSEWIRLAKLLEDHAQVDRVDGGWPPLGDLPEFALRLAAKLADQISQTPKRVVTAQKGARRGREPSAGHDVPLIPRFSRYLSELGLKAEKLGYVFYPGLTARPWHDPSSFPIVAALERHFPALRDEVSKVAEALFQPESESIRRTGKWDVAFLYECGRRRDEVCDQCPTLATIVDTFATMRTIDGLIYISRLRSGSEIQAHYGPTNLRLRCHLGVQVPAKDCGISVDGEVRTWEAGKCLVFDDTFSHYAWNHSAMDRTVVVIDLWHPDLSEEEITLLSGLARHVLARAMSIRRYFDSNARARLEASAGYH